MGHCGELVGATYTQPQGILPIARGFGTLALAALGDSVTLLPAYTEQNAAWEQFQTRGGFAAPDQAKPNAPTPTMQNRQRRRRRNG